VRGLGDFQRAQMRRGDPRIRRLFSLLRELLDTAEDIYNNPHQPSVPAPPPAPPAPPQPAPPLPTPQSNPAVASPIPLVCARFGVTRTWVYEQAGLGNLTLRKAGRRTLVLHSDIERLVAELPPARIRILRK
jgi:hypothetical protein